MSDFFASLADKALARAEGVIPRPATLFGPSPYAEGPFGAGAADAGLVEEKQAVETAPVSMQRISSAAVPQLPTRAAAPEAGQTATHWPSLSERPRHEEAAAPPMPGLAAAVQPLQPAPENAAAAPPLAATRQTEHHILERQIETIRIIERSGPDLEPLLAQLREPHAGARAEREPGPRETSQQPAWAGAPEPRSSPAAPSTTFPAPSSPRQTGPPQVPALTPAPPRPGPVVFQPQASPAPLHRELLPPAPEPPAPPAPTIQVTIGRIEVRATTSPAPAPERRQERGPRLGLEEYLRRRNGEAK